MRDRLIELYYKTQQMRMMRQDVGQCVDFLLENDVIVLPCKIGDKVFYVNEICDENANEYLDISIGKVVSFSMQKEGLWAYCRYEDGLTYWHLVADDFGKTVFLTREEAEQALKGGAE